MPILVSPASTAWRWTFSDPATGDAYTFEINPNTDGSPQFKKTVTYQSTAAADGGLILFEGRDAATTLSFSGTILTQAQYNAMIRWFGKRHQVIFTDDLGRITTIYITAFSPKRKFTRSNPWRHEYSVEALVLNPNPVTA
jgi:hypothetical protein